MGVQRDKECLAGNGRVVEWYRLKRKVRELTLTRLRRQKDQEPKDSRHWAGGEKGQKADFDVLELKDETFSFRRLNNNNKNNEQLKGFLITK